MTLNLQKTSLDRSTWDVIVIGAGPAGSMAALNCVRNGLKTLIVEKRTFPRYKVCGACINENAISVLQRNGLESLIHQTNAVPLGRFVLRYGQKRVEMSLPGGVALSRGRLDQELLLAACTAGAEQTSDCVARVLPLGNSSELRSVELKAADSSVSQVIQAKVIIAADGLGHSSLQKLNEFQDTIERNSRLGAGGVLAADCCDLPVGTISMSVARDGYVGLVRQEEGLINLAACLSASSVRESGIQETVRSILEQSGICIAHNRLLHLTGTRPLTHRINSVASRQIFVVGDAAAYVEPFTGEGIAWGLSGGEAVVKYVQKAIEQNSLNAHLEWESDWRKRIARQQYWCRKLATVLKHSVCLSAGIGLASVFPAMTSHIIQAINTSPAQKCGPSCL